MVMGLEKSNQFSLKSYTLFKPFIGLSSVSIKKDSFNLSVCKSGGQRLMFHLLNLISAKPTPPKDLPFVKKSYEAIPNNFKVPSSTTKESAIQKSSSVGPTKCDAATLIKTSSFSSIRTKTTSKIKTISENNKQVSGSSMLPILPA